MKKQKNVSIYLSYLLRHRPDAIGLNMDKHGWVDVHELINGINQHKKYFLDMEILEDIVKNDEKGRYRFNEDRSQIKACQGHSLPWVEPELKYIKPPHYLYHGTTADAFEKIKKSGEINKMARHAVHLQSEFQKAWKSAIRWQKTPVVLKIDAKAYSDNGAQFGKTENGIWCIKSVPVQYIVETIYHK